MDRKYLDDLARVVTKAGVLLLENGAEVYRVEDSMYRLAKMYGCSTVDSYATPTLIIISFTLDGELSHNVKRVNLKATNLWKVEKTNQLIRTNQKDPMDLETLNQKLDEINNTPAYSNFVKIAAAFVFACGFAIAFHGTLIEILISGIIASLTMVATLFLDKTPLHSFFKNAINAFLITIACIGASNFLGCDETLIINSTIMLLVPGLIITNAIRDSISGDLNSSLNRFLEALYIAISVGLGSAFAYILVGVLF